MPKLTLQQANLIIESALAKTRQMKIKPLDVVVLDESGDLKAARREDAASMFRIDIAQGKAWAAFAMGDEDEAACIAGIEQAGLVAEV